MTTYVHNYNKIVSLWGIFADLGPDSDLTSTSV